MIYVDRNRTDDTGKPFRPSDDWFTEAARATAKLTPSCKITDLYNRTEVQQALRSLFRKKCSYCEKSLDGMPVEHYRPKGSVHGEKQGYYWLAYTWENLYSTCGECNSVSRHPGTQEDPEPEPHKTSGKGTYFPLRAGSVRATKPGDDLNLEDPLILDPCQPSCENRFYFESNGRVTALDSNDEAARYTIERLGLNRIGLRDKRAEKLEDIRDDISSRTIDGSTPFSAFLRQMKQDIADATAAS